MARKLRSELELIALVNSELARHEACRDCRFDQIIRLHAPDENGCNWKMPNLRCRGNATRACLSVAREIVGRMKKEFNLSD